MCACRLTFVLVAVVFACIVVSYFVRSHLAAKLVLSINILGYTHPGNSLSARVRLTNNGHAGLVYTLNRPHGWYKRAHE